MTIRQQVRQLLLRTNSTEHDLVDAVRHHEVVDQYVARLAGPVAAVFGLRALLQPPLVRKENLMIRDLQIQTEPARLRLSDE